MNKERPNEKDAKSIIEFVLGIGLEHADTTGGVDYRSAGKELAVEVTRVTNGKKKSSHHALSASRAGAATSVELRNCWLVFLSDTQPGMKAVLQNLPPLFAQLEATGETRFERQAAALHVVGRGPLSPIYRPLLDAGVERASGNSHQSDPSHSHRVIPMLGSGGSSSGSDEALEHLTEALGKKTDNVIKLAQSGAPQRHLFVWLDDDTRFDIARPLSHDAPSWADEGFGVPSRAPSLDPAVTHLWVVHERARLGWLWDGRSWRELRSLPSRTYS